MIESACVKKKGAVGEAEARILDLDLPGQRKRGGLILDEEIGPRISFVARKGGVAGSVCGVKACMKY